MSNPYPGDPNNPTQQPGYGNQQGYPSQPMQPGYGSQPMQPGYGSQPMQPGYGSQPMQPGYGSPPMQPGYGSQPMQPDYGSQPMSGPYGASGSQPNIVVNVQQQSQQGQHQIGAAGVVVVSRPNSGKAIASMILGFCLLLDTCSWLIPFGSLLPLATGIAAVILGHLALKDINASGGALGGKGMAITGLVLGYIEVGIAAILLLILILALASVGAALNTPH